MATQWNQNGPPQWQGQPQYPQQSQYGQPQYGHPQYPQAQYGPPQYNQAQYGAPQYGPPHPAPPLYGHPHQGHPASGSYQPGPYPQQPPQPSQHQGYPQPGQYQHQHQSSYQPPTTQPSQAPAQTCYNCGSPDHWAMNCTEPKREVPAGETARQSNGRPPFKRTKPNGPVITKYAVPPHLAQGYGVQPHTPQGPPNYSPQYMPPTPGSTYSPQTPQWPYPTQQQPYPPHYHGSPPQLPPYPVPPPPNATSPYGPQTPYQGPPPPPPPPDTISSQWLDRRSSVEFSQHHYQGQSGFPIPNKSAASPASVNAPSLTTQERQSSLPNGQYDVENRPDSAQASESKPTESVTATSQNGDAAPGLDDDDLNLLDLPDIPREAGHHGGEFARLVGIPLPADSKVVDAMPLPPPSFEADGKIQSRYMNSEKTDNLLRHIKDTDEWSRMQTEIIFHFQFREDDAVPLIEWLARREGKPQEVPDDEQSLDVDREEGEVTQENDAVEYGAQEEPVVEEEGRPHDILDSLEDALNTNEEASNYYKSTLVSDVSPPLASKQGHVEDEDTAKTTEDRLAALGVTGAPKPPSPRPLIDRVLRREERSSSAQSKQNTRSRSRSLEAPSSARQYRSRSISDTDIRRPLSAAVLNRQDLNGWGNGFPGNTRDPQVGDDVYSPNSYQRQNGFQPPPPPPPPPVRRRTTSNTAEISPNGNGYGRHYPDANPISPSKLRENSYSRKREYEDSDEEPENERRRQSDDFTVRQKRKSQPKVAEAYSRRW